MRDQGRADAAFMDPMFVFAERSIADIGPILSVGDISVRRPGHNTDTATNPAAIASLHRRPDLRLKVIWAEWFQGVRSIAIRLHPTHRLRAAAVVLKKKDERVVELILLAKLIQDATDS